MRTTVFIVDYDIPITKNRFRFYRDLKRLKEKTGLYGSMSTQSVLVTYDEALARRVFALASRFTLRVHIYRAVEVV